MRKYPRPTFSGILRKLTRRAILGAMTTQRYERIPVFTPGDRLRKARELAGLDQGELSEATGISRSTVSHLELDKAPLKSSYVKLWAMATGVPPEWLATGGASTDPGNGGASMTTDGYTHSTLAA